MSDNIFVALRELGFKPITLKIKPKYPCSYDYFVKENGYERYPYPIYVYVNLDEDSLSLAGYMTYHNIFHKYTIHKTGISIETLLRTSIEDFIKNRENIYYDVFESFNCMVDSMFMYTEEELLQFLHAKFEDECMMNNFDRNIDILVPYSTVQYDSLSRPVTFREQKKFTFPKYALLYRWDDLLQSVKKVMFDID